jgi:hypothetical protein
MKTVATFQSSAFNTTVTKDYFINPECFGDDLARWLITRLRATGTKRFMRRFDAASLYAALDRKRIARGLNWTQLADEIGISAATIKRTARGGN